MNSEYVINYVISTLQTYLPGVLVDLQAEASSSIVTPSIAEYKFGEHDPDVLTLFPSIQVYSPLSRRNFDNQGFQDRTIWLRILTWVTENDLSNLHRFGCRYNDGVARVLRNEQYYGNYINNILIEDSSNTDQYQTNVGYAQGYMQEVTVDYILA